jgi:hypothetical protein
MALANSKVVKDEQAIQKAARAAIEARTVQVDERTSAELLPVSKGRHLDVDAVLARSLVKVVGE